MNDEEFTIPVFHEEQGVQSIVLTVRELEEDYLLWCSLPGSTEVLSSQASDCFAALQGIRRKAEGRGWKICCAGSRQNVWPSAMSRQMGGGVKAYILKLGEPGRQLVEIFDPDDPESYCSVAEQEAFAKLWFDSLGD